tara:strand:- start:65291 stop:66529 length:1239 start_codon:yes stop_codon:yes gene_type:complete
LYTNNITSTNAIANWTPVPNAHHYKIHYKEISSANWSNLGNIDSTMTSRLIPMLQPLTTYIWEIKTFCDSTNQNSSSWSNTDTFTTTNIIQCINTDSIYTNSITHENAVANWKKPPNPYHYKIHYREISSTNWLNLGNIDSTMTSRLIPLLQPLTTYIWEIKTFCDSTNQFGSGWSYADTFTTNAFIPAPFNPIITPIISNLNCGENTSFTLVASQQQNEPDIQTSIFTSNGGYFEISTLNNGDILGDAYYTSNFNNYSADLILDFTLGPNYAKIDIIDSLGYNMGFFTIENILNGIKVSSIGPFDGNNYTSGYISQLNFTNLFVNPLNEGPLNFTTEIESELGDFIQSIDSSIIISCNPSSINNQNNKNKLLNIIDVTGRFNNNNNNKLLIYIYENRKIEKKIILNDNTNY